MGWGWAVDTGELEPSRFTDEETEAPSAEAS